jgi:hypothetical protein
MAVAYAELGDFDSAVYWQEQAIGAAQRTGTRSEGLERCLKLFRDHKSLRSESNANENAQFELRYPLPISSL